MDGMGSMLEARIGTVERLRGRDCASGSDYGLVSLRDARKTAVAVSFHTPIKRRRLLGSLSLKM